MNETGPNITPPAEEKMDKPFSDLGLASYYVRLLTDPTLLGLSGSPEENLRCVLGRAKNAVKGLLDIDAKTLLEGEIKKYEQNQ